MKKSKFLQKTRIYPEIPKHPNMSVVDLLKYYSSSGAYNGGRLAEACQIYEKMIREDATICLTLSGALTPAGLGGFINQLIKNGLVDFIISTGANLYHDIHFALDLPVHQGDFRANDVELLKEKIVRIYDIFLPEETLLKTDEFIQKVSKDFSPEKAVSSASFHRFLGEEIIAKCTNSDFSVLATAAKHDVPIYTPSPGDSSIGMNLALLKMSNNEIIIDTDLDILETTAIVISSKKTGAVELGGGAPKNFYMQTQPMLSQIMNIEKGGHDYFIQITSDAPHWGGLSGATPSEAISWKKIKSEDVKNDVVVYCDVSIAAPLIFSYILSKKHKRKLKRLYTKRKNHLNKLKYEYIN
jgi:deoxyhypusine synthase